MAAEVRPRMRAIVFIFMLAGSEVSAAQPINLANRVDGVRDMHLVGQIEAMMTALSLREQTMLLSKQIEALVNLNLQVGAVERKKPLPSFEEQTKQVAELMESAEVSMAFREQANRIAQLMVDVRADPNFQELVTRVVKQLNDVKKLMADFDQARNMDGPNFQQQTAPKMLRLEKLITEKMDAIKADSVFQEQVELLGKQMEAEIGDPGFQRQAEHLAEKISSMAHGSSQWHRKPDVEQVKSKMATIAQNQASMEDLASKKLEPWVDKLFARASKTSPIQHEGVEATTIGKAGHLANHASPIVRASDISSVFSHSAKIPQTRSSWTHGTQCTFKAPAVSDRIFGSLVKSRGSAVRVSAFLENLFGDKQTEAEDFTRILNETVWREPIVGAKQPVNYVAAAIISAGASGFLIAAASAFLRTNIVPFIDSSQLQPFPQGVALSFYGTAGALLATYLWIAASVNVGAGYNEFNKDQGVLRCFRYGLPGNNRTMSVEFPLKEIEEVRVELDEGFGQRRGIKVRTKNGEISVTEEEALEPMTAKELETRGLELSQFLGVPIRLN